MVRLLYLLRFYQRMYQFIDTTYNYEMKHVRHESTKNSNSMTIVENYRLFIYTLQHNDLFYCKHLITFYVNKLCTWHKTNFYRIFFFCIIQGTIFSYKRSLHDNNWLVSLLVSVSLVFWS